MGLEYGWKKLLEDNFRKFHPETTLGLDDYLAVDANQNGEIEFGEIADGIIDGRMDYYVDEDEAREFCNRHGRDLARFIPFLDSTISHGFSTDNPIIELILFESQIFADYYGYPDEVVEEVYEELEVIKNGITFKPLDLARILAVDTPVTIENTIVWAHDVMAERGVMFEEGGSTLFMENFVAARRIFDCDISTYAFMAAAYELGWEIQGVSFPEHLLGRYISNGETGEHLNIEVRLPASPDDDFYINYREHGQRRIDRDTNDEYGTYLSTLTDNELRGTFFFIFGSALLDMSEDVLPNHLVTAKEAFDEAIRLYPTHAVSYINRCSTYSQLGEFENAIADCNTAKEYDPNDSTAYANLGLTYIRMAQKNIDAGQTIEEQEGLYEQAADDLTTAIDLDPDVAELYTSRSQARVNLGLIRNSWRLIRQARSDAARALELDPDNQTARDRLGEIELSLNQGL